MVKEDDTVINPVRDLTGEEASLYDRQIRLWGLKAQRRLVSASALIIASRTTLLVQELAKNLVLAGIASLTLNVLEEPGISGFLGNNAQECKMSLSDINPLVDVKVVVGIADLECVQYAVVCTIDCSEVMERKYAALCRDSAVPFFCGRAPGYVGFFFLDLGTSFSFGNPDHAHDMDQVSQITPDQLNASNGSSLSNNCGFYPSYAEACDGQWGGEPRGSQCGWHVSCCLRTFESDEGRLPGSEPDRDCRKMQQIYEHLQETRNPSRVNSDLIDQVARTACYNLPPVAAIVGGMWGREVIKVLSRSGQPLKNFFFFSAVSNEGSVDHVGPNEPAANRSSSSYI